MVEKSKKLKENELAYALAILDAVGEKSVEFRELSRYHSGIVDWLISKELLLVRDFTIGSRTLERRVALGLRALDFNKKEAFDYRMKNIKLINDE